MSLDGIIRGAATMLGGAAAGRTAQYQGAGGVAGIKKAYAYPPDAIDDHGFVAVVFPPRSFSNGYTSGSGNRETDYELPLRLFIRKVGQEKLEQVASEGAPFIEPVIAAFESGSHTVGGIQSGLWWCAGGSIGPYDYAGSTWLVVEFILRAREKTPVTPAP